MKEKHEAYPGNTTQTPGLHWASIVNYASVVTLLLALTCPTTVFAQPLRKESPREPSMTAVSYAKHALQGYEMRVWISNQMVIGTQAFNEFGDPFDPRIGVEYPAGSGVEHVYGGGPMIGGIVDGVRRVSQAYNGDDANKYFRPDPLHPLRERIWQTSVGDSLWKPNRRGCDDDADGRVDEDDLDGLDNDGDWNVATDDVGSDGIGDAMEFGCRGGYDALTNPDPNHDNYDTTVTDICHPDANGNYRKKDDPDAYTEKNGIADHGEPNVDEDYAAISNNDLYCSATDVNDPPPGNPGIGIKLVQKTYAWTDPGYGAVIPFEFTFVNIGHKTIEDVYVGYFMDADVGPVNVASYFTRNYVCYIDTLRTAYQHNPMDRSSTPIGLTVLGTPRPLNELNYVFQWFNFTDHPGPGTTDSVIYSYMSGEPFPDNPVATCGSPTNPSDARFLFSFGPFESFAPGETLTVTFALISGDGVESARNSLKENAGKAHLLYERMKTPGASLPRAIPWSPLLRFTKTDKQVLLDWSGSNREVPDPVTFWDLSNRLAESYPDTHWRRSDPPCVAGAEGGCGGPFACDSTGSLPGGRSFEGYRLYRSEHQGEEPPLGSFSLVREYDVAGDGIGYDFGLDSVFVDSNLQVGRRYWYAVTAFSIPDMNIIARPLPSGEMGYDTIFTPGLESYIPENRIRVEPSFRSSDQLGEVRVVPNPYRVDADYTTEGGGWEGGSYNWTDFKRMIRFINLPGRCTIRIYTIAGDVIATLEYEPPANDPGEGYMDWRLVTGSESPLASGMYVFSVDSQYGTEYGKFVVIR